MQVNKVNLFCSNNSYIQNRKNPAFTRRLSEQECQDYSDNVLRAALDYLGVKSVAMIMHGSCYPVTKYDLGIGSPCGKNAEKIIEFEKTHGFNAVQLGPLGEITRGDISPYSATVFAINKMFIDPEKLLGADYAEILAGKDIDLLRVKYPDNHSGYTHSKFFEAFENYDKITKIAYSNFVKKLAEQNPEAIKLNEEYENFKDRKGKKALMSALFELLSRTYGTRDVSVWENEIDRNLPVLLEKQDKRALARFQQLLNRSQTDIEAYIFAQFLVNKQLKENKAFRDSIGFEYISDNLVGNDVSEEWMYPDVFLKDYRVGCPEGGRNNQPQIWNIPALNPKKLLNGDGSLGPAGIFLREKLDAALEYCENIRIDHALGLVDPYVYDKNSVLLVDGNLDKDRFYGDNISKLEGLDPAGNYQQVLEKIVLPVLKEHGIDVDKVVWEDLGNQTDVFKKVYITKLGLPGMTQLHWTRGENSSRRNWGLMGSHDEPSALSYVKDDNIRNNWDYGNNAWSKDYLAGYLNSDPERYRERETYRQKLAENPLERIKAKYAEMFISSDRVQIPFNDFFGIEERYNEKGTKSAYNWKLRLDNNFENRYYENLESDIPTAINMPEILKMAVQAKADRDIIKYAKEYASYPDGSIDELKVDSYRVQVNKDIKPIIEKLDYYEKILKEKSSK